jgi:Zn-dependent M16 (insulinase) family peptidase
MDIAYCVQAMPAPHLSNPDAPTLSVASRLLSLGYCWEEIRIKGGAYGGGCRYSGWERTFHMSSYRDPAVKRTLDVYKGLRDHIAKTEWSQTDIDRAIIGTAKDGERPFRPGSATGGALWRYLCGDTKELREARHAAVLRATPKEVKRSLLELIEANLAQASVCVVSSREKLENANKEMPNTPLAVEDIIST